MVDDYRKFCLNCAWNDADQVCICPSGEELWQCEMYRHYHPEEVKMFDKEIEQWIKRGDRK